MKKISNRNKKNKENTLKNFLKKYYLLLLIILLVVLTVILIVIKVANGKQLEANDKIVKELYSMVSNEELNKCDGLVFYGDNVITYDSLDANTKMCIAFNKAQAKEEGSTTLKKDKKSKICTLAKDKVFATDGYEKNECSIKIYSPKSISEMYKKIYNKDIPSDLDSFQIDDYNICYLHKDKYYCGLSETFSFTIGNDALVYRVIDKAAEKGSSIVIYDYFIKINNDKCYRSYTGTKTNDKCKLDNIDKNNIGYKFLEENGTLYKHTFKKENSNKNYSWVSSEPINK